MYVLGQKLISVIFMSAYENEFSIFSGSDANTEHYLKLAVHINMFFL